jgi:hypothetical protein
VGATENVELPPSLSDRLSAREIATWVLSRTGGSVAIVKDGKSQRVPALAQLPEGSFELEAITLQGPGNAAADLLTDDTLRQYVASATSLKRFHVQNSTGITDRGMEAFRNLPRLEELRFTPGGSEKRKNPGITNATFAHLAGLKNLRVLELDCTPIHGEGLASLASAGKIERLSLSVGQVSSEGVRQIGLLTALKSLSLWWDKIKDADMVHFKTLENLEFLDLNSCGLDGSGAAHLVGLKKLNFIYLTGCRTNAFLPYVREMSSLKTLIAGGSRVTEAEWAELQAARPDLKIRK